MTFVEVDKIMNSMKSLKPKKRFVIVSPKSLAAKHRFVNIMKSLHSCEVEKETTDKLFLVSLNKQYRFCVQKEGNEHWEVTNK
jgi:plasmid maintenance system killer protein